MRLEGVLKRVYLVRHGEVAWNRENSYVGRTDLPLNETGIRQAEKLAEYFADKGITRFYCSPLRRAVQTAEIVASKVGSTVVKIGALQEINYGAWEGLSEEQIKSRYPDVFPAWRTDPAEVCIPEGETFNEVLERALPAFNDILARANDEGDTVVVAHKSVNRALICAVLGISVNRYRSLGQDNACINTVQVKGDNWLVVENINETCHLLDG